MWSIKNSIQNTIQMKEIQWRIQDFPGNANPKGEGTNLLFSQFFPKIRLDLLTLGRNPQRAKFSLISLGFSGNTNTDQSKLNMGNLNQTEFTLKTWYLVTDTREDVNQPLTISLGDIG